MKTFSEEMKEEAKKKVFLAIEKSRITSAIYEITKSEANSSKLFSTSNLLIFEIRAKNFCFFATEQMEIIV